MIEKRDFSPRGPLALEPSAFGALFERVAPPSPSLSSDVAVVSIRGPLVAHPEFWCDSYDSIVARVRAALELSPKAVVLSIDSPGGLVAGCFDAARSIRSMCDEAGVQIVAHVDGMACSAAYALACVAHRIVVSDTSIVGSVGIVDGLVDVTGQNAMVGVRVQMIGSGARKLDGNPNEPLSDDAVNAARVRVRELAEVFFEHVAASRPLSAEQVREFEAATFVGARAVEKGLADVVGSASQAIAIASGGAGEDDTMTDEKKVDDFEATLASLRKAAEGDDENAARAKKMLAALEEKNEDEGGEPKGEHSEPDGDEAPKKEEAKAFARIHSLEAQVANMKREKEVDEILASRPDFSAELVASLRKLPLANVREMVRTLPRKPADPAASAVVGATRGQEQGTGNAAQLPVDQARDMRVAMGMETAPFTSVIDQGQVLILGAMAPTGGR